MTRLITLIMNVKDFVVSETDNVTVKPGYPLYPYQRQVFADIITALSSPDPRVVAHLPTGAGKTRIASHVACYLLNKNDAPKSLLIWLSASEELCEQAAGELTKAWTYLGMRDVFFHRYWGNHSINLRQLQSGFLVAGLAKLRSSLTQDNTILSYLAACASAVIFDEAHQAVAETYSFITEQLCSARPPLLGLTATPGRTANLTGADYQLANMFNHKKVSIDPRGHDNPVTYLIKNRYLASPQFIQISFDSDISVTEPPIGIDYSKYDLEQIGQDKNRTQIIVRHVVDAAAHHLRTIVFCPSVESAQECNYLLQDNGFLTYVVTSNTEKEQRREIIDNFKSDRKDHMVMFNFGVLTTGFDAPKTSCVIIARPTNSLVLYSQMVGRALRGPRSGGNSKAEILTVADTNLPGFGSVSDAFKNWEELWQNH